MSYKPSLIVFLIFRAVFIAMSCASAGLILGRLLFAISLIIGIQCVVNYPSHIFVVPGSVTLSLHHSVWASKGKTMAD